MAAIYRVACLFRRSRNKHVLVHAFFGQGDLGKHATRTTAEYLKVAWAVAVNRRSEYLGQKPDTRSPPCHRERFVLTNRVAIWIYPIGGVTAWSYRLSVRDARSCGRAR